MQKTIDFLFLMWLYILNERGTPQRKGVLFMDKKTFRVEKGRGKAKVVQFVELTTSEEDIRILANFAWSGWKIEEVKK